MGSSHTPTGRVLVPPDVLAALRALISVYGKGRASEALGCSKLTLDDATCEGARLRPEMLGKLRIAIEVAKKKLEATVTPPMKTAKLA
jgi:hypothetical protein